MFVKHGFRVLAFVFGPIWLMAERLWFAFFTWFAATLVLGALVGVGTLPSAVGLALNILVAAFLGLEGSRMISNRLARAHRHEVAVVTAGRKDEAESIFFSKTFDRRGSSEVTAPGAASPERDADSRSILGLFPEAGR